MAAEDGSGIEAGGIRMEIVGGKAPMDWVKGHSGRYFQFCGIVGPGATMAAGAVGKCR
jgi:hypothetical protein